MVRGAWCVVRSAQRVRRGHRCSVHPAAAPSSPALMPSLLDYARVWGGSSAGRASRSQCEGREFDPPPLHHPHIPGRLKRSETVQQALENQRSRAFFLSQWAGTALGSSRAESLGLRHDRLYLRRSAALRRDDAASPPIPRCAEVCRMLLTRIMKAPRYKARRWSCT